MHNRLLASLESIDFGED